MALRKINQGKEQCVNERGHCKGARELCGLIGASWDHLMIAVRRSDFTEDHSGVELSKLSLGISDEPDPN